MAANTDPSATPSYLNPYDTVNAAYTKYLGRPASQSEWQTYWANDPNYLSGIQNSGEAQAYAAKQPSSQPGSQPASGANPFTNPSTQPFNFNQYSDPQTALTKALNSGYFQSQGGNWQQVLTDAYNTNYGYQPGHSLQYYPTENSFNIDNSYAAQGPNGGDWGWNTKPGGSSTGGGVGAGSGTGFADPAYNALATLANNLVGKLNTPASFPQLDQLMSMLTAQQGQAKQRAQTFAGQLNTRVGQLQQPLMSDANVAQQHALASNKLIAQRDADVQRLKDSFAARGINPNSALAAGEIDKVQKNYSDQQASIDAQLQQANISTDEQRRNEATQLEGLVQQALQGGDVTALQEQAQAADLENQLYGIDKQRQLEQLSVAQIPVDLTNQGFANAEGAAGNPSNDLASLMSLINTSLYGQGLQFNQSNAQTSGIMNLISGLLNSGAFA